MPTALRSSTERARAAFLETSRWRRTASVSCDTIVLTGFSEVIGSWKIIAISSPRMLRSCFDDIRSRSFPFHSASPDVIVFAFGLRPMIVRHVTLLPEPDAPTIPKTCPFSTAKLTPSTALTIPSSVRKCVLRSLTSSSATGVSLSLAKPDTRVDGRVQEVHREIEDDDRQGSEDHDSLSDRKIKLGDRQDCLVPESRERENRLGEDRAPECCADVHAEHRHDRKHRVPEDMRPQHLMLRCALRPRGTDVILARSLHHVGADHPHVQGAEEDHERGPRQNHVVEPLHRPAFARRRVEKVGVAGDRCP